MPWNPSDAPSHTRQADTPKKQSTWARVANERRNAGAGDASAIRQADSVVKKMEADSTYTVSWTEPNGQVESKSGLSSADAEALAEEKRNQKHTNVTVEAAKMTTTVTSKPGARCSTCGERTGETISASDAGLTSSQLSDFGLSPNDQICPYCVGEIQSGNLKAAPKALRPAPLQAEGTKHWTPCPRCGETAVETSAGSGIFTCSHCGWKEADKLKAERGFQPPATGQCDLCHRNNQVLKKVGGWNVCWRCEPAEEAGRGDSMNANVLSSATLPNGVEPKKDLQAAAARKCEKCGREIGAESDPLCTKCQNEAEETMSAKPIRPAPVMKAASQQQWHWVTRLNGEYTYWDWHSKMWTKYPRGQDLFSDEAKANANKPTSGTGEGQPRLEPVLVEMKAKRK